VARSAPGTCTPAIIAKAKVLTWLMTMEHHDGLAAMRDIQTFTERARLNPDCRVSG
jgi:hypothetical protein